MAAEIIVLLIALLFMIVCIVRVIRHGKKQRERRERGEPTTIKEQVKQERALKIENLTNALKGSYHKTKQSLPRSRAYSRPLSCQSIHLNQGLEVSHVLRKNHSVMEKESLQ